MDPVELLSTVNAFYDQAFNKLMTVTFGVLTFIGLFVPLGIGYVQVRSLRNEKESMLRDLRAEIEKEREALRHSIEIGIKDEMARVRADLEARVDHVSHELRKSSAAARAATLHLQGQGFIRQDECSRAIDDLTKAACLYIDAGDETNAQRCIKSVIEKCLPKTNADDYKKFKLKKCCDLLTKKLLACNENGRYTNSMQALERAMEAASGRHPE
jgi:hypothetical protein